jgi:RimJ/RimL family protein N-acetyltransferase
MSLIGLVACEDGDFAWMLGSGQGRFGLSLPPGGVDDLAILQIVRRMNAALRKAHDRGTWMIVQAGEVVGLCGYIRPPAAGEIEIGFGVAASRRRQGYATAAVGALLLEALADPLVTRVSARTAVENFASQRVLECNGFRPVGTTSDEADGDMIVWSHDVEAGSAQPPTL